MNFPSSYRGLCAAAVGLAWTLLGSPAHADPFGRVQVLSNDEVTPALQGGYWLMLAPLASSRHRAHTTHAPVL